MGLGTEKINREYDDSKEGINDTADEMNSCAVRKPEDFSTRKTEDASDHKKYADEETKEKEILQYNEHEVERIKKMGDGTSGDEKSAVTGAVAADGANVSSSSTDESKFENNDGVFYISMTEEETIIEIPNNNDKNG